MAQAMRAHRSTDAFAHVFHAVSSAGLNDDLMPVLKTAAKNMLSAEGVAAAHCRA